LTDDFRRHKRLVVTGSDTDIPPIPSLFTHLYVIQLRSLEQKTNFLSYQHCVGNNDTPAKKENVEET
jgi:hypothetical protein